MIRRIRPLRLIGFLVPLMLVTQSSSARRWSDSKSSNPHPRHQTIQFLMRDVLNGSLSTTPTAGFAGDLPFSKPVDIFPPRGGIPVPEYRNPTLHSAATGSGADLFFPARATLQELELGAVTSVDEEIFREASDESREVGRAQGVCVADPVDAVSQMVAITAKLSNGESDDELRLFGVRRNDDSESQVSVIGGTGKYAGANGYAAVKSVDMGGRNSTGKQEGATRLLQFTVYLR